MLKGIGTDIVQVSRIRASLDRHGDSFAERLLTADEFAEFKLSTQKAHFLAKRFAAKEAVSKAFGTGFREGLWFSDIEVCHTELGGPFLKYSGKALQHIEAQQVSQSFISISDEKDYAVAFVILVSRVDISSALQDVMGDL